MSVPMIRHHLPDSLLMAYSTGTLPEAFDLAIATHLSLCDACRAAAESYDALGGALLEETDDKVEMTSGAFDALMARLDESSAPEPATKRPRDPVLPEPLASYVGGGLEAARWRPVGRGVRQAMIPLADKSATARLLHIPAGTAVPDHGHRGTEITLVLQGAFTDADGTFARGDVEVATDELDHMPVADIAEDCICLAVTDAPLQFKALLPRIAQPFLGI